MNSHHFHITNTEPVIRALANEWRLLERDEENLSRVANWDISCPTPETLCDVTIQAGLGQFVDQDSGDRVLYELVRIAVGSDHASESDSKLAARVVLQRLLPGLITIGSRRGRICDGGFTEAFSRVLSEAWTTLVEFPIDRRTQKIASNILRDSESRAFWRNERATKLELARREVLITESARVIAENEHNAEMYDTAWEIAHDHLSGRSLEVFEEMFDGVPSAETAERLGLTTRAIRYHRTAVTNQLRNLARLNLSELVTTNTLDPAIANPATIGSNTPVAANGSAATL